MDLKTLLFQKLASNQGYRKALKEELSRYERGEDVPLSELPEELQKNVEDPPPSVKKLRKKMIDKMSSVRKKPEARLYVLYQWVRNEYNSQSLKDLEKAIASGVNKYLGSEANQIRKQNRAQGISLSSSEKREINQRRKREVLSLIPRLKKELTSLLEMEDYDQIPPIRGSFLGRKWLSKFARYERGEDVPLSELPEEFQEMNEDPPPSVKKLRKKMIDKMSSQRRVRRKMKRNFLLR